MIDKRFSLANLYVGSHQRPDQVKLRPQKCMQIKAENQ